MVTPHRLLAPLCGTLLASLLAISLRSTPIHAQARHPQIPVSQNVCVVPVRHGAPTEADVGSSSRMLSTMTILPGVARPFITPLNRGGRWTIDETRAFVPEHSPFPRGGYDEYWTRESSGRLVGVNSGGVYVLTPGEANFRQIAARENVRGDGYSGPSYVARTNEAFVRRGDRLQVLAGEELRDWSPQNDAAQLGLKGLHPPMDLPRFAAMLFEADGGKIALRLSDGSWHHVHSLKGTRDYAAKVYELPKLDRIVVIASFEIVVIDMPSGTRKTPTAQRFRSYNDNTSARFFGFFSAVTGDYLFFDRAPGLLRQGQTGLQRLNRTGFEPVPGGDILQGTDGSRPNGAMVDLPSLGRVIVQGAAGFYLYDGAHLAPVPNSGRERVGRFPRVHASDAIGRVLVTSDTGAYELTRTGELPSVLVPFEPGSPAPSLADMPASGAVIAFTKSGAFAFDRDLRVERLQGVERVSFGWLAGSHGIIPIREEMIVDGGRALFLVIDARIAGEGACALARRPAPPESDICLRPVPGINENSVGILGAWAEAPSGNGLILAGSKGVFHRRSDGTLEVLDQQTGSYIRDLVKLEWSGELLVHGAGRDGMIGLDDVYSPLSPTISGRNSHEDRFGPFASIDAMRFHGANVALELRRGDSHPREVPKVDLGTVVDAPWLGHPVAFNSQGLWLVQPDWNLTRLILKNYKAKPWTHLFSAPSRAYGTRYIWSVSRLRSILGYSYADKAWKRITPDLNLVDVPGLEGDGLDILAIHEPPWGDVFVGTSRGLFRLNSDGKARRYSGPEAPSGTVRLVLPGPDDNTLLAAGDDGLFQVRLDAENVQPIPGGDALTIGSVRRFIDVPWRSRRLIITSFGVFALDGSRLTAVTELAAGRQFGPPAAFVRSQKAYVVGAHQGSRSTLYELRRSVRDADSGPQTCSAPL